MTTILNIKYQAFTLFELLIAFVLIAILLLATMVPLKSFINKNKAYANANQIISGLQFAKSEAITRGVAIIFCKSKDHRNCGGNWSDGQIITDENKNVSKVFTKIATGGQITWHASFGKSDAIVFAPNGTTYGLQGSFYYCPNQLSTNAYAIILEYTGKVRLATVTATGDPIPCL
jgi:type IV fimbrial biogenesis protein FimT